MIGKRVSLCMIVRDSSGTLAAALQTAKPWVDEIVVVDTGSRDNTPDIACNMGASVYHFPWCDDFAAARNESLRHAEGDWLFWMDSDDTIDASNGGKLRQLANLALDRSPTAYVMQVHCPGPVIDGIADVTVVDHVKMFRNLAELRFEGRIHEQILPAVRRLDGEVRWSDVFVVHSGADHTSEARSRKQERDLRLLQLELQDRPDHPFALFNLGMTFGDMNRHDEAVAALRRCLEISKPGESHVRKAYALLVCSLSHLGRQVEAMDAVEDGLRRFPTDPELNFRLGLLSHRKGWLERATSAYKNALNGCDQAHFASLDRGITGHKAHQNLAIVYSEQGKHDLAELQWREVIRELPTCRPAWHGLGDMLIRQNRFVTADVEIERMSATPSLICEAMILRHELAVARGDLGSAARVLEDATACYPDDLELLRARCRFLFEHGEGTEAEQSLGELCRREPADGAALHNLGTLYFRMGRLEEAKTAYERSLAVRPNHPLTKQRLSSVVGQMQAAADSPRF